jgi:hypothetical protein
VRLYLKLNEATALNCSPTDPLSPSPFLPGARSYTCFSFYREERVAYTVAGTSRRINYVLLLPSLYSDTQTIAVACYTPPSLLMPGCIWLRILCQITTQVLLQIRLIPMWPYRSPLDGALRSSKAWERELINQEVQRIQQQRVEVAVLSSLAVCEVTYLSWGLHFLRVRYYRYLLSM